MTDRTNIVNTESRKWPYDWHIYNCPWLMLKIKVKVMQTSDVNISQTVTDMIHITITNTESRMWYFEWYITFDLDPFQVQSRGQARFDSAYLANGDRREQITISNKYEVVYGLSSGIFRFHIGLHSKSELYCRNGVLPTILALLLLLPRKNIVTLTCYTRLWVCVFTVCI